MHLLSLLFYTLQILFYSKTLKIIEKWELSIFSNQCASALIVLMPLFVFLPIALLFIQM